MVKSIKLEIRERESELQGEIVETIYFGGGTPSILEPDEISEILKTIHSCFKVIENAEITIEANPDDLKPDYLRFLKDVGINRLSIGIQSFHDKDLEMMRRSHKAAASADAIENSLKCGFNNINIDLIYGLPWQDFGEWSRNLDLALQYGISHISAYHLTFESGTVFDHWRKKGRITVMDEEQSIRQMELLIDRLSSEGYDHYEISNFALPGYISKHNTGYWKQVNYMGFGPSAHSYNGITRRWNVCHNLKYIQALQANHDNYFEYENLSLNDLYNEYVLTSLRTKWGIDLKEIKKRFGEAYKIHTLESSAKFISEERLFKSGMNISISRKGIMQADYIIAEMIKT